MASLLLQHLSQADIVLREKRQEFYKKCHSNNDDNENIPYFCSMTNRWLSSSNETLEDACEFFCLVCEVYLKQPYQALQHFTGRSHRNNINTQKAASNGINDPNLRKRTFADSEEKADEAGEILCEICNISFTSLTQKIAHNNGKKHINKVAASATIVPLQWDRQTFCEPCNIQLNSIAQMTQHCNGLVHKVNTGVMPKPTLTDNNGANMETNPTRFKYRCEVCNVNSNSESQYADHVSSERHKSLEEGRPPFKKKARFLSPEERCSYDTTQINNENVNDSEPLDQRETESSFYSQTEQADSYTHANNPIQYHQNSQQYQVDNRQYDNFYQESYQQNYDQIFKDNTQQNIKYQQTLQENVTSSYKDNLAYTNDTTYDIFYTQQNLSSTKETKVVQPDTYCAICNIHLTSAAQLRQHKQGTTHKVNAGIMLPTDGMPLKEVKGVKFAQVDCYCEICDLQLTSPSQLEQHKQGASHKNKLAGKVQPHSSSKHQQHTTLQTDNLPRNSAYPNDNVHSNGHTPTSTTKETKGVKAAQPDTHCAICNIHLTSSAQLRQHKQGATHKVNAGIMLPTDGMPLKEVKGVKFAQVDCYCEICDLQLTSPSQLEQHKQGASHKNKLAGTDPVKRNTSTSQNVTYTQYKKDSSRYYENQKTFENPLPQIGSNSSQQHLQIDAVEGNNEDSFCNICNIQLTSNVQLQQHRQGLTHKVNAGLASPQENKPLKEVKGVKVASDSNSFCHSCNIQLTSAIQLQQHLQGATHKINAGLIDDNGGQKKEVKGINKLTNNCSNSRSITSANKIDSTNNSKQHSLKKNDRCRIDRTLDVDKTFFRCHVCRLNFFSKVRYTDHLVSVCHKKNTYSGVCFVKTTENVNKNTNKFTGNKNSNALNKSKDRDPQKSIENRKRNINEDKNWYDYDASSSRRNDSNSRESYHQDILKHRRFTRQDEHSSGNNNLKRFGLQQQNGDLQHITIQQHQSSMQQNDYVQPQSNSVQSMQYSQNNILQHSMQDSQNSFTQQSMQQLQYNTASAQQLQMYYATLSPQQLAYADSNCVYNQYLQSFVRNL